MQPQWHPCKDTNVLDPITAFRLSRGAEFYPHAAIDDIWWSALVDLRHTSIDTFTKAAKQAFPGGVLVSNHYSAPERTATPPEQLVTVFARRPFLTAANTPGNPFGIVSVELGAIVTAEQLDHDAPDVRLADFDIPVGEDTVVMAVIDDGIAFANDLFRSGPEDSRVEMIYIMASATMSDPSFYTLGRQLGHYPPAT